MTRLPIILLVAVLACKGQPSGATETRNPGGTVSVPSELASRIREAKKAKLHRITGEFSEDFAQHRDAPKIGGYPAFESAIVPSATTREIAMILTDGRSYLRENETWMCLPQPFYLIELEGQTGAARIVIHECGDVEIIGVGTEAPPLWQHGLRASRNEEHLWELLRQVLPSRPNCCGESKPARQPKETRPAV